MADALRQDTPSPAAVSRWRLPALPDAEFYLLPARRGESEYIGEARLALSEQLG